jgi:hypothetical protein
MKSVSYSNEESTKRIGPGYVDLHKMFILLLHVTALRNASQNKSTLSPRALQFVFSPTFQV